MAGDGSGEELSLPAVRPEWQASVADYLAAMDEVIRAAREAAAQAEAACWDLTAAMRIAASHRAVRDQQPFRCRVRSRPRCGPNG